MWFRLLELLRGGARAKPAPPPDTPPSEDSRPPSPERSGVPVDWRRIYADQRPYIFPPARGAPRPPETLPPGYRLLGSEGPEFFDPAVQHYRCAFRHAEPVFVQAEDRQRWLAARQRVMDHVLGLIARSPWQSRLVLRGSALLRTQLGAAARRPGDIDWVVLPPALAANSPSGREIIDDIARLVGSRPQVDAGTTIDAERYAIGAIWTYERAEGRRLTFTWSVDGLPPGTLQQDFVYGEPLAEAPAETAVTLGSGATVELLAASPALSLCWKLLWLGNDIHPQGKDLYDAVLLAECTRLPPGLLEAVVTQAAAAAREQPMPLPPEIDEWDVDWENFRREYPDVAGDVEDWKRRLAVALARSPDRDPASLTAR
ncbi:MAG: hypothetical protein BGP24_10835 [Lysobacterales bacterium 69-70]|nr:MAG: hypothetical protein ABT27_16195 [Xanthomonadaceae bacterium SCN 69-25]OJZ00966.1 MAG: hypothetical protein BGP24_10835 [Xanthomonadales bacterium 69-70]